MAERNQAEAFANNPDPLYEPIDYDDFLSARPFYQGQDRAAAGDIPGYEPDPEAATQRGDGSGFDGSDGREGYATGPLEPGRYSAFDDPQGAGAQGQHDSLKHDARAVLDHESQDAPVYYRGHSGENADFDITKTMEGMVWFTQKRGDAEGYGDRVSQARLAPNNPLIATDQIRAWVVSKRLERDAPWQTKEYLPEWPVHRIADLNVALGRWARAQGHDAILFPQDGRAVALDENIIVRSESDASLDRGPEADPQAKAREAQETQLRADAPMRGENRTGQAQDGTMGLELFDSADSPGFRFDEEGDARQLRDVLDELDADEAELNTIRDCLK